MKKINLLMTMAGEGSRFVKYGINTPKPLITINGKPFFYWATESVLKSFCINQIVFCVLKKHVMQFGIDKSIHSFYPNSEIVIIDKVLDGPVLTALNGIKAIKNKKLPVLLNDCDHMFACSKAKEKILDAKLSGLLLTFNSSNPSFSYVKTNINNDVIGTIEKEVVSCHAICGAYYFKSSILFEKYAKIYLKECSYSEFFVSGVYNSMIKNGLKIGFVDTDYHISFGTPQEYCAAKNSNLFSLLKLRTR